ncbi:MAG: sigma 54-interacting transcriptional regulator [Holophagales bacterium]|nr:sigma 54-interacting transcriptional regulator [Holophagales bacterium]
MNRPGAALPPRFEARAALSEGTSPRVVAAFDRETGRRVVLKIGGGAASEDTLALRKEFRLLASLDHPSIVKARDFGFTAEGLAWFSTDEVDGPDLATFARSHALLENLSALADVAHALDYVHSRGLVHGDVKPTNVRVLGERAFLLDFGLAFARGEEVAGIRGTPAYLAPEVLRGGKPDRRADLYALGVTFYEALTGVLPTAGRDLGGVLRFHLEEDVPVASRVTPGMPSRLDRILAQLMERDPAARTPSARTLLDDLGRDFGLVRGSTWDARPELLTPPFCGRVELLGRFTQALRHAAEGSGKAIVVLGPEGAGKSRLLAEWRALAQSEGALVVEGRAVAEDRTPYRPVLDVLSALTRRGGSAGAPARAALARVARLAATGADAPPISRITEESSRLALFDEVLAALEATRRAEAGERPLVVLVDDLHLADRATAALLSFLFKAAESRPLIVAAAAEPAAPPEPGTDPNEALAPLEDLALPPWTLAPLSDGETVNAAAGALGRKDLPEELARLVQHESQGWPGPLVALLEQLVEKRVVSLRDGQLVVDAELHRRFSRPGAAAEWADSRLAALPPARRELLAALSVVPADLTFELALRLSAVALGERSGGAVREADALADALGALAFAGLLGKRELSGEPVWEFALARTREHLAASLPDEKRRLLHDAAAGYFEERLAERPDLLPSAALHALRGSDAERAVRLGLASAARAERLFAYDQAAQSYSGVLEFLDLAGRAAEKAAVRERLGDVHFRAGNWRRALSAYHFLLKELGVRPDADDPGVRRHAALLTFKIGMIRLRRGDVEAARALFDRAEGELGTVGTTEERARLLDASARARLERGDPDGAEAKAEAALALAGPDLPDDLRSLLLGTLGTVAFQRGDHTTAHDRLTAAVEAARRSERGDLVRRALSALAAVLARTGRWQESEAMERECLDEAERSRDLWGITASLANLATLQCGRGDYGAARSGLERAFEIHRRLGSPLGQAQTAVGLGACDEVLGRWDEAEASYRLALDLLGDAHGHAGIDARAALGNLLRKRGDLDRAERSLFDTLDAARGTGEAPLVASVLLSLALLERDRERLDEARRHLDQVVQTLSEGGATDGLGRALADSAELAFRMGEIERCERETAEAGHLARGLGDRHTLARIQSLQARLSHHARQTGEADRLFEDAVRGLSDIGAVYDLGRCYYEWGVRTLEKARAAARLGTAARLFERIGALRELERTRGVLERIATKAAAEAAGATPLGLGVIGLYEVSRIVNSTRDLSAVLADIVDLALKRLNAERGMILLADPVTGRLSVRVARNLKTGREDEAEAISRSVVERVVADGRSVSSADARVDPRFQGRESIHVHAIVSFLCVPLLVKERASGAIYVDHRNAPRLFSESDCAFLEAFADLAAVAIENARLVEELLEARLRLSVENESLKANLGRGWNLDALVGRSEAAKRVKATLPRAAAGPVTVLIRGESGTGKNLVARILHALSPRAQGPFIQFNCAALPETLAESELFGHEKGSFTGADRRKPGRFELAQGGTIFLDEIGKTSLGIQAKLLRVVEDKEFERVGGTQTLKADTKIISATNLDLEAAIKRNEFREDLFYRLNVVPIELPPLRSRLEDLPALVEHFVVKLSRDLGADPRRLDSEVLDLFARYPWPGNIRELEATLHRALVLTPGEKLGVDDFPWILESPLLSAGRLPAARLAGPVDPEHAVDPEYFEARISGLERDLIARALGESGGKIREASRRLGLARNTLKAKMAKYGLRGHDSGPD